MSTENWNDAATRRTQQDSFLWRMTENEYPSYSASRFVWLKEQRQYEESGGIAFLCFRIYQHIISCHAIYPEASYRPTHMDRHAAFSAKNQLLGDLHQQGQNAQRVQSSLKIFPINFLNMFENNGLASSSFDQKISENIWNTSPRRILQVSGAYFLCGFLSRPKYSSLLLTPWHLRKRTQSAGDGYDLWKAKEIPFLVRLAPNMDTKSALILWSGWFWFACLWLQVCAVGRNWNLV